MKDQTSLSNETKDAIEGDYLEYDDGTSCKSAYQVAVEQGFMGTQAEWLACLMGGSDTPAEPFPLLEEPPSNTGIFIA